MKPKIMITFTEGGENGGPFVSHKRIMESELNEKYDFIPLIIPKGRIGLFNIPLIFKLYKNIKYCNPDIVHFDGLQLKGFHVAIACKLAGMKNTVLAIHGSSLEAFGFPKWKKFILNIFEIITIKTSKVCYGVSEYVSNWERIKKHSKWCFGHIYNLYEEKNDKSHSISFREEIGLSENDIVIVSTGRITREKGYDILLEVIKKTIINKKIKYVIAGEGDYLGTFRKEIKTYKLDKSVFFLGYRNDVSKILFESDIFIMCTLHETLCISILEACFNSLPVIATNIGGIPEIVENEKSGYLVQKNDIDSFVIALEKLVNDKEKRKEMGNSGKEIVENKFSRSKILAQIDDLYQAVLTK